MFLAEHLELEDWWAYVLCLMITMEELSRLQNNPELFSNKHVEVSFWEEVFDECDHFVKQTLPALKGRDEERRSLYAEEMKREQDRQLPARDLQRKPWEQFLNNRAAGSGADFSQLEEGGSIQLIPMASVRIVMNMLEECRAAAQDIEEV